VGDGAGEIPLSVADLIAERASVMPDKGPVMTSPVYPSVKRDRDAVVTSVTAGPQTVHMTPRDSPYPDSFLDMCNQ